MSDHAAFLRAVLETPDDDTPRLVFADWLDEHGDPLGEFVRVQCELERLPADDPRRDGLEARERALLGRHERDWLGPFRPMLEEWRFRRGFVDEASADFLDLIRGADDFFSAYPVRSLAPSRATGFDDDALGAFERLLTHPGFARLHTLNLGRVARGDPWVHAAARAGRLAGLERLELPHSGVTQSGAAALAGSPHLGNLAALDLTSHAPAGRNMVGDAGVAALARSAALPRLTELLVGDNGLSADGVAAVLTGDRRWTRLDLSSSRIGDRAASALARAPLQTQLTDLRLDRTRVEPMAVRIAGLIPRLARLDLSDNALGANGLHTLMTSPAWGRLEAFDFRLNGLGPDGADAFAVLPPARLARLDLSGNELADAGVRALARSGAFARLEYLALADNNVTDAGAAALAGGGAVRLRRLHLGDNAVRSAGLRALWDSSDLTQLRVLNLRNNPIGNTGLVGFAAGGLPRLTGLGLGRCEVGAAGVRELAASPRLARIGWLDLSHNGLTDADLRPLADSPFLHPLTELDVTGNAGDGPAGKLLRERLGVRLTA